jgi:hypothetical protein
MSGSSYPETESRLSDIALAWMIEEAVVIPGGLKVGPVFANGEKLPNTGNYGQPLHLFPAADGVQHSEIAALCQKRTFALGPQEYASSSMASSSSVPQ